MKKPRAARRDMDTVPTDMKAPAQILLAAAAAGAVAFLPLSTRFQEAGFLREKAAKRRAELTAKAGPSAAEQPGGAPPPPGATVPGSERIPPGVSAAEASATIAAIAALDGKMLSSRQIVELLGQIMALPESHMEEAMAAIEKSKNMVLTGFMASALYSRWGELNPDSARAALAVASKSGNPVFKFAGAAALAGGWMEKDPDAFIKWVTEKKEGESRADEEMRQTMMNAALAGMANIDPATAEKLIAAAPPERRAWMIMDMAENDPNMDPKDAAARALAEASDDGQRNSVHWRLARMLADKDPKEAIKYGETLPENERRQYYESGFASWMKQDKTEAMKWMTGQPESVQTDAVRGMRGQFGKMSYEETVQFADQMARKAGDEVWFQAAQQKADENPQEALQYLPNVSEEKRHFSYEEVAHEWTQKDPEQASEWLLTLEPGKQRDHAIQGMLRELRTKEPDSGTIWAATVEDEKMRERLVQENARLWLKRDRPAAEEWINGAENLSDAFKDQLLAPR